MRKTVIALAALVVIATLAHAFGPLSRSSGPQWYKVALSSNVVTEVVQPQDQPWNVLKVRISGGACYVSYKNSWDTTNGYLAADGAILDYEKTDEFNQQIAMMPTGAVNCTAYVLGVRR